ncbi:MAG: hypothetical protein HYU57_07100 [Micavibrio aeruginosavorus]|nr:hypothetical protein [Micavibrio aeruginosavorus]
MTDKIDAKTVTAAQMEQMSQPELKAMMTDLVNAYNKSKSYEDGNVGTGDISRLQLRTQFYDRAYGLEQRILPISHAEWNERLTSGAPKP